METWTYSTYTPNIRCCCQRWSNRKLSYTEKPTLDMVNWTQEFQLTIAVREEYVAVAIKACDKNILHNEDDFNQNEIIGAMKCEYWFKDTNTINAAYGGAIAQWVVCWAHCPLWCSVVGSILSQIPVGFFSLEANMGSDSIPPKVGTLEATLPGTGIMGSVLELVGPVSVYCNSVKLQVWPATSIKALQHIQQSVQIHPRFTGTLLGHKDSNQHC